MMRLAAAVLLACALGAACVTVGRDFPTEPVRRIVMGSTSREQLLATFGEPYQRGLENGKETWTWYRVRYRGPRSVRSRELHVVFDDAGVVESYSFSSNEP